MRNLFYFLPILILTTQSFAQQQQGQNGQQQMGFKSTCDEDKILLPSTEQIKSRLPTSEVKALPLTSCEKQVIISRYNSSTLASGSEQKFSLDKRFSCKSYGGQTLDYVSCMKALNAYNAVFVAEQGLSAQQAVRKKLSNDSRNEEVKNALAQGNEVEAMNQVYVDSAKEDKGLYTEQMATFGTAASGLWVAAGAIQSNSKSAINSFCKGKDAKFKNELGKVYDVLKAPQAKCEDIFKGFENNQVVFANQNVKNDLRSAAIGYGTKAGLAFAGFQDAKRRSEVMEQVMDELAQDDPNYMVDPCIHNPQSCIGRGQITPGSGGFGGNSFGPGGSGANQNFDFSNNDGVDVYDPTAPTNNPNDGLTFDQNPFVDEAKEASGILDPAAAANVTAASGMGAGGGGGSGGLGGGGSASLGDDLQGVDDSAEGAKDIKSNKFNANYASGKGGGFEAIGKSKDENGNPFASLFDNKDGGGGIEEDRSIASGDIDGKASGLFQKISNRYGHVQKSNRLASEKPE